MKQLYCQCARCHVPRICHYPFSSINTDRMASFCVCQIVTEVKDLPSLFVDFWNWIIWDECLIDKNRIKEVCDNFL